MNLFDGPALWLAQALEVTIGNRIDKAIEEGASVLREEINARKYNKQNPNGLSRGTGSWEYGSINNRTNTNSFKSNIKTTPSGFTFTPATRKDINYMEEFVKPLEKILKSDYYCIGCGQLINRYKVESCNRNNCNCGMPIVNKANMSVYSTKLGKAISQYLSSSYWYQNKYPFNVLVSDKGKVGEYLIDVAFTKAWSKVNEKYATNTSPVISPQIYFNVNIPEPNGSFQEADAIVVVGEYVILVESKNYSGEFDINTYHDVYWKYYIGDLKKDVYNPLMQNREHIAAIQSYLFNEEAGQCKLGYWPQFCSLMVISDNCYLNQNLNKEALDKIEIGDFMIANHSRLEDVFVDFFSKIVKNQNNIEVIDKCDQRHTKEIVNALKPLIGKSADLKNAEQEDRQEDKSDKGKRPYEYYYAEYNNETPYLIRTNMVHVQTLSNDGVWYYGGKYEKDRWNKTILNAKKLEKKAQKVIAYQCVIEGKLYK